MKATRRALEGAMLLLAATAGSPDELVPHITLERMAFTSCVKAWRPGQASLWPQVEKFQPQFWLWTGDAVYANSTNADVLPAAFAEQLAVPAYRHFLDYAAEHDVKVDGVWDDHDLGVNDGGAEVDRMAERQNYFLDFLGLPADHPRRERQGLYKSVTFGSGEQKVKIIMLDVRSFRSHYIIPSTGAYFHWLPAIGKYMPFFAAACRYVAHLPLPFLHWRLVDCQSSKSTVLGSKQWAWLEDQLAGSDAKAHIFVSSTQVATSNPIFEGWSHFPRERKRLFDLIERHRVPGAVIISGDVHHGEISRWPYASEDSESKDAPVVAVEITASGSTHSLGTSKKTKDVYPPILQRHAAHRVQPAAYYSGLNFGTLEIRWPEDAGASPELLLAVRDVESGSPTTTAQLLAVQSGGSVILSSS